MSTKSKLNTSPVLVLHHYTDKVGAKGIQKDGLIKPKNGKLYLTKVPPQKAKPLMSENDTKLLVYFLKNKMSQLSLKENVQKLIIGFKFKYRHGVVRKFGNMVPVGKHKLQYIVILITDKSNKLLKKDKYGKIYVTKAIKKQKDPNFLAFGPYKA